ncbi:MAG TPA: ArsA family ATPase [Thermoanaerobaculia bacterium]|jgi:anion-transporting  ArsA/GET3 family ATPase
MKLDDRLGALRLLVVTGKGGTGKSVTATALGRILAARGRRTLLLEVDPRENLHHLCGVPPSGGEIVAVAPGLWLQNLKPEAVADWVVEKQIKVGVVARRILKSPVYHRFVEGAPGLTEIAILGHALRVVRGQLARAPAIDTVILDAPATGHGVFLLTAPRLFVDAIGEGPFAELARQVADFVSDPAKTGLAVVTLAEEMPVQEALELRAALAGKLGREPELLVANGLYPPAPDAGGDQPQGGDALTRLWHDRRRVNDKELARLAERWRGPRIELPLLPVDAGPELVAALAELLAGELNAEDAA